VGPSADPSNKGVSSFNYYYTPTLAGAKNTVTGVCRYGYNKDSGLMLENCSMGKVFITNQLPISGSISACFHSYPQTYRSFDEIQ
jgi:hypothetical protein